MWNQFQPLIPMQTCCSILKLKARNLFIAQNQFRGREKKELFFFGLALVSALIFPFQCHRSMTLCSWAAVKIQRLSITVPFQEEVLKDMEQFLERHRSQFPRLYFLSNADLVDMVGISRNPQALVPFARKCFPGITSLTFTLPPGTGGLNSALDFALNSKRLFLLGALLVVVWSSFHGLC